VLRRLLVGLPVGVVAVVLLGPELFGLADDAPFVQVVAFRPMLAAGLLVLSALTVLVRQRWWPVALLPAVVAAVALGAVVPRAVAGAPPPAGSSLTVLSFNVFVGRADPATLAATIRANRPDLVVLPEAGQRYQRRLTPLLAGLGYRSWVTSSAGEPDSDGIVVLAAARLGNVTGRPLELDTRRRWMTLTGGGLGDLTLVAVHTAAPVRDLPGWASELGTLRQWCGGAGNPHLVVGDVNATLDHAPLRAATAGCTDAAAALGEGLVATWPTAWPRWLGVQIDHVFTSGGPVASSVQVLDLPGSDHRALFTRIVLPGG
jgi:endonuclease/exonuclease/phosphatase (EEP) superfamily protein YafD